MTTIYSFNDECEDKDQLGTKGANLVTMSKLKLPVPQGFIVSVETYELYKRTGELPEKAIIEAIKALEKRTGKILGKDLSVSVCSSAPTLTPGMVDTILDMRSPAEILIAIKRIFRSWDNPKAMEYRRMNNISADIGTAVIVQAMVFGDLDDSSGTGMLFTRNPSTGEKELFGEYLHRANSEDFIYGQRTPQSLSTLKDQMADLYKQIQKLANDLENHFNEMQDIDFTIESGKLYSLQTRTGKRSGQAAVRIAVDMAKEGRISRDEALLRVTADNIRSFLHRSIESSEKYTPITRGLGAAPGAISGRVIFYPFEAVDAAERNEAVILVKEETSPDDIQGIVAASGIITSRGGFTSHAALVTRAMGKPCICGAEGIKIDLKTETFTSNGIRIKKGDTVTMDGKTGDVYLGALPLTQGEDAPALVELISWADEFRKLKVKANADTPEAIALARKFGAEGIGLCRTERHFSAPDRLDAIKSFIVADTVEKKDEALGILRTLQKGDFVAIFQELKGMPIVIRLLDLPLHEFLPSGPETTDPAVQRRIRELKEKNPKLGHRGVRLAITSPEIYKMQIDAISDALGEIDADVSIIIPQVITLQELLWVKRLVEGRKIRLGCMMETVRACMRAEELAGVADFLSFETDDLSQAVFSFSKEDAEKKFLTTYLEAGILKDNPFTVVDVKGVGRLMKSAISWARKTKPDIEIGVCGKHGGDSRSIIYFHSVGVSSVSCNPFRIPIAKLAAAQAAIVENHMLRAGQKLDDLMAGN